MLFLHDATGALTVIANVHYGWPIKHLYRRVVYAGLATIGDIAVVGPLDA